MNENNVKDISEQELNEKLTSDKVVLAGNQANGTNGWRWQDRGTVGFVVKRHVARNDWHIERGHGSGDAENDPAGIRKC